MDGTMSSPAVFAATVKAAHSLAWGGLGGGERGLDRLDDLDSLNGLNCRAMFMRADDVHMWA